jgi:DNA-binding CsgD family transcriptional regulator
VEARCRALLARDATAEHCFEEAVAHLQRTPMVADLARAELLYGEWLRRERRRADARRHLRTASALFVRMGAESFAERTRLELLTTGVADTGVTRASQHDLSAQELRVARLASEGLTNQQIANQLFISVSTVDYHLRKVFRKLDINSRSKLHLALPHDLDRSRVSGGR